MRWQTDRSSVLLYLCFKKMETVVRVRGCYSIKCSLSISLFIDNESHFPLTKSPISGRRDKVGRALPRHHHHRGDVHAQPVASQLLRALALAQVVRGVRHAAGTVIVVVVLEARL